MALLQLLQPEVYKTLIDSDSDPYQGMDPERVNDPEYVQIYMDLLDQENAMMGRNRPSGNVLYPTSEEEFEAMIAEWEGR
jgi:hypothetical protein